MKQKYALGAAMVAGLGMLAAPPAAAGPDPFIGEVSIYPYNFCPRGWAPADGQLLPIADNTALFSLYGTMYGGDGRTTFGLPDLRGRVAVGTGAGPGLTERRHGETFGAESTTLGVANLPAHSHAAMVMASPGAPDTMAAAGAAPADFTADGIEAYSSAEPSAPMAAGSVVVGETGGGQPVATTPPSLALQYCVALQGIYPSRN